MATYFWVGGTGTWDASATANWSASSGGAGGAGPPLSTDIVNFDASSGTGTCTTAAGSACATATLNSATLGLTLGAAHSMSGTFTLTQGTLSLGSFKLTCNVFSTNNSNTRTIAFGTGDITLTGNNATIWVNNTVTGMTVTGTPVVNCTYSGAVGTRTVTIGAFSEANSISFNITAGTDAFALATTTGGYRNINFTGYSGALTINNSIVVFGNLTFSSTMSVTAGTTSISFTATSGIQLVTTNNVAFDRPLTQNTPGATVQLQDNLTMGSTRAYTLTAGDLHINNQTLSTGLFSSSNSNTRTIDFKSGNITVTGNNTTVWTTSTSTGLSVLGTPTVNATYSGSTGTRTITTSSSTTESNAINFNISAGSDTISTGNTSRNINFTGFSGTLNNSTRNLYGDLIISSGMTLSAGTNVTSFLATSGTKQITTQNKTFDFPLTFNGVGGTFAFQDALTQGSTRAFTITNGTVQLKASVTSTIGSLTTSSTNQKFLQSTLAGTQATLSQVTGTVSVGYLTIKDINATGGATFNAYTVNSNVNAGNNLGWDFFAQLGKTIFTRRKEKRVLI